MREGAKDTFTPKMRSVNELRPSRRELGPIRKKLIAVAAVLGIGTVVSWCGGLFGGSSADTGQDFPTGQGNEQTIKGGIVAESGVVLEKTPFNEVFPNLFESERKEVINIIDKMNHEVIRKNQSFRDMVWVTQKNEAKIRQAAQEFGIPENIVLGIVLIENGGGDDLTSKAGARGPCQFLVQTAIDNGLKVDLEKGIDQRIDPDKCFRAMGLYLSGMKKAFGDNLGITVWGYHAGYGNVYKALREYFKDTKKIDLGDVPLAREQKDPKLGKMTSDYYDKIVESKLNVHELLSNQMVKDNVLVFLEDETELYPYKAVAGAEIFSEEKANE